MTKDKPCDTEDIKDALFPNAYKSNSEIRQQLLELYKLYIDTLEKAVARRQLVHTFFLSINVFLLSVVGFIGKDLSSMELAHAVAGSAFVGCVLSGTWLVTVLGYRRLSAVKFDVLRTLESHLPASLYAAERVAQKRRNYRTIGRIESLIPSIFISCYSIIFIFAVLFIVKVLRADC
ncbi:MAG: hypothetical protein MN733_00680 [Nitrososphaera sp.]|nr:hypothetical protein [Nitrososphaera sp.]